MAISEFTKLALGQRAKGRVSDFTKRFVSSIDVAGTQPKKSSFLDTIPEGSAKEIFKSVARVGEIEERPSIIDRVKGFFADRERFDVIGQFRSILQATPEQRRDVANKIVFDVPIGQKERVETKLQDLRGLGRNEPFRLLTQVGSGVLATAEGLSGALEWAGVEKAKPLGDKFQDWQKAVAPEDRNFLDGLASGVGSVATFFIPSSGAEIRALFIPVS